MAYHCLNSAREMRGLSVPQARGELATSRLGGVGSNRPRVIVGEVDYPVTPTATAPAPPSPPAPTAP